MPGIPETGPSSDVFHQINWLFVKRTYFKVATNYGSIVNSRVPLLW